MMVPPQCEYAIFMCGNAGAGKSTLGNVLGAKFEAGFSLGEGLTKECQYAETTIDGDSVLLIDAPGMYEASVDITRQNAREIQKALGVQIPYKIAFVCASNGGRWKCDDAAMIDKVVLSIGSSESNGRETDYILIINQIQQKEWSYYTHQPSLETMVGKLVAATTSKRTFATTICCPYLPGDPSESAMLKAKLLSAFKMTVPSKIKVVQDIKAHPDDLKFYEKALIVILSPLWAPILGICAAFSSVKNRILYNDWEPFI
ncbi:hypothetical protein EDD21DRAFT_400860 [Dissophora ornata]|nr:hypothetical protein EDD21DRAFT_400860 [Dissophora ornata]